MQRSVRRHTQPRVRLTTHPEVQGGVSRRTDEAEAAAGHADVAAGGSAEGVCRSCTHKS